jgi:uncharacterized protein (TIGR02611 family)
VERSGDRRTLILGNREWKHGGGAHCGDESRQESGKTMSVSRRAGAQVKKAVILMVGVTVALAGVALLALPGPGMIVIIVGLLILSAEFAWAQRWLDIAVEKAASATSSVQGSKRGRAMLALSGVGMIAIGVGICVAFSEFWVAGVSIGLAGAIGLATLHPRVADWVEEKALTGIDDEDNVPARTP